MKAIINSVTQLANPAYINVDCVIKENDGTVLFEGIRGLVSTEADGNNAKQYIKDSLKNIGNQIKNEKASKLKEKADELKDGGEFNI